MGLGYSNAQGVCPQRSLLLCMPQARRVAHMAPGNGQRSMPALPWGVVRALTTRPSGRLRRRLTPALGLKSMAASTFRKRFNAVAGLFLLAGIGYMFWPFVVGRSQMQNFCTTLPIGASVSQVQAMVTARGYKVSSLIDGEAFVHDPRSMGSFNCVLHFGSKGLASAPYADNP
jgi:hypothetical protein